MSHDSVTEALTSKCCEWSEGSFHSIIHPKNSQNLEEHN